MKPCFVRAIPALSIALLLSASLKAQTAYSMHTIAAGETLSALAKEYHTTVGDIMRINGMHADSKLQIGEKVKIPATSQKVKREEEEAATKPAKQAAAAPAKEPEVPAAVSSKEAITHTVQKGESLYRISKTYKIPVDKLMALNHITNAGAIKVGQVLIVSDGTPPPAPTKTRAETASAATVEEPVKEVKQPAKEVQQPEVQPKQAPASTTTPVNNNTSSLPSSPVKKPVSTPAVTTENNAGTQSAQPTFASNMSAPKEGFFTTQFRQNVEGRSEQTKNGAAMTFKSASGWADKKFYILMNDAPPGSIVKVTNGNNVVYAKVLWSLGTQKENDGLDFRVSTATAAALHITDEKFDLSVTYFQ
jgi:LysM repeat protein